MIKKIKSIITTFAVGFIAFIPLAVPATVHASHIEGHSDIQSNLCAGANLSTNNTTCEEDAGQATSSINDLIADVINIFSLIVGIVAVIMIIVGGFRYITSGGDSNNVTAAKNTILYAIIGLVIVALAQFIVRFVLDKVTA